MSRCTNTKIFSKLLIMHPLDNVRYRIYLMYISISIHDTAISIYVDVSILNNYKGRTSNSRHDTWIILHLAMEAVPI